MNLSFYVVYSFLHGRETLTRDGYVSITRPMVGRMRPDASPQPSRAEIEAIKAELLTRITENPGRINAYGVMLLTCLALREDETA